MNPSQGDDVRGLDHPHLPGPRRLGRRLTLLALALVLTGCNGGGGTVVPGGPDSGAMTPPPTTAPGTTTGDTPAVPSSGSAGSADRVTGGSGNAGPQGTSPETTSGAAVTEDPGIAVAVGGPMLFIPNFSRRPESFGEVVVGGVSAPRSFQVRSPREYPATVVALESGDASFQITENRCTGVTLPPNGAGGCTLTVTFSPRETGQTIAGVTARMTHTCTSDTYIPCSWTPEQIEAPGTAPNFTRVVLPSGQVRFDWRAGLDVVLVGQGTQAAEATTEAADPMAPSAP
jgi:hypothetical protein